MVVVQQVASAGRVARRPVHNFQLRTRPWQIQPFFIAPVLPGETMKNLALQSRVRTDPVKNGFIGWWNEYYLFYVKLRDLDGRADFENMILTPGYSLAAYDFAANASYYHAGPGISWVRECLKRVTSEYFRDEGESWDAALVGGLPLAGVNSQSWLDSAKVGTISPPVEEDLPGPDVELPDWLTGWENQFAQYQHMRELKLTEATFEDWLRSFGVTPPKAAAELHRPELIRFIRDWAMPVDAQDSTGAPAAQVRWVHQEKADKDRFFKEPGFLFGVTVSRPKVYMGNQKGSASAMLNNAFSFLPALMSEYPYTSLREFQTSTGANGPLGNVPSGAYWVDVRDLYLYGDQFANFDIGTAGLAANAVALPTASLAKRFATDAEMTALFSEAGSNQIRSEGVVSLAILGTQQDHT